MKYKEIFLLNQIYVVHPNKRVPVKLAPRDEVAHPTKLQTIVNSEYYRWKEININEMSLYYTRFEYDKRFYEDLSSSHFYILTNDSSTTIFTDAKKVDPNSTEDMFSFLNIHGFSLFGVTSPVFRLYIDNPNVPDIYYSIPVSDIHTPMYLAPISIVEVRDMIETRCYTVCNGFTLFLAMIRAKQWNSKKAYEAMQQWYKVSLDNNTISLDGIWHDLYVHHPVPMISDCPTYYATMYPPVPTCFLEQLYMDDTIPLSQFVDDTNIEEVECFYATPMTSMFPYFNKDIFDYYNKEFLTTDHIIPVFDTPFSMEEHDIQFLDIEGFFISILRSRRAWKWWKQNGPCYLRKAYRNYSNSHGFFMYCFQVLFYLYTRPYIDIKYSRSKVRSIWIMLFNLFHIAPLNIKLFINIITIKKLIYEKFGINRWNPDIPISFMIDILNIYKDELKWFDIFKKKVYTSNTYDHTTFISIFSPYMYLNNESRNEYMLSCSVYQLLKLDVMGSIFIKYILDKTICGKLLCIQHMFGLKKNVEPLISLSENDAFMIGTILKEYLRSNRDLLI